MSKQTKTKKIIRTFTDIQFEDVKRIVQHWLFKEKGKWFYMKSKNKKRERMEVSEDFATRFILDNLCYIPAFGNQSLWRMKYMFVPDTREWKVSFEIPTI